MKRLLWVAFLLIAATGCAQTGVDTSKWYVMGTNGAYDNYTWCDLPANVSAGSGLLTLSTTYGPYSCQGYSENYGIGMVASRAYGTYGKIVASIKFAGTGSHSTFWLVGGPSSSLGYPPTCLAALMMADPTPYEQNCIGAGFTTHEIDVAEHKPGTHSSSQIDNYLFSWTGNPASNTPNYANDPVTLGFDVTAGFHVYELDWTSTTLTFKVDGSTVGSVTYSLSDPMMIWLDMETDPSASPGSSGLYLVTTQYQYVRWCSSVSAACTANTGDILDDEFPTLAGGSMFSSSAVVSSGLVAR